MGVWAALQAPAAGPLAGSRPSLDQGLGLTLTARGWRTDARDVHWVDPPLGGLAALWRTRRVLVLAHHPGEPADVLLARVRLSPEGRLLAVTGVHNLSDTAAVDESSLQVRGERALWTVRVGDETSAIYSARLSGAAEPPHEEFSGLARLQMRLTWHQETGQFAGIHKQEYRLEAPTKQLHVWLTDTSIIGELDGERFEIAANGVQQASPRIKPVITRYGHPGNLVTWAVDRVRALPWVGSDRVQLLKTVAFAAWDRVERTRGQLTADDGSSSLKEEVGHVLDSAGQSATDPESGWPPASMQPVLKQPLPHEGQWSDLQGDPFIARGPTQPAPFLFSFIRTDRERPYTKVFVVLWDPRHLDLHMMSGTREPKTATGETGPGQVPRDPQTLARFVGAFNGGFQATHGEFGMMADGVVYLPPKPYAATVARLKDGSTAFGTWPNDETIPESIASFRQNLTPLVMDDQVNPYRRTWWGGVPPGWEDATRTVRTGLCLTREGFVGYFYGSSIDSTHLASAMQAARCAYGLQLDMNPGHTGFEFYRLGQKGSLPELGRKLDGQWEARGEVAGSRGWEFLGRRMIRYMNLMHFPRYIRPNSRDFFYLTSRRLLPLEPIESRALPKEANEGVWTVRGLEQKGWPPVIAMTRVRPDPSRPNTRVSLIALDPRWLSRAPAAAAAAETLLAIEPNEQAARSTSLWLDDDGFELADTSPSPAAVRLASGTSGPGVPARASAAIGAIPGRLWVYAEIASAPDSARDAKLLESVLREIGVDRALYFGRPLNMKLGSTSAPSGSIRFTRRNEPRGIRIFQSTPIVSPKEWMPLQDKRVRYHRTPKPRQSTGPETSETPSE